jgi:hypothetical protein
MAVNIFKADVLAAIPADTYTIDYKSVKPNSFVKFLIKTTEPQRSQRIMLIISL